MTPDDSDGDTTPPGTDGSPVTLPRQRTRKRRARGDCDRRPPPRRRGGATSRRPARRRRSWTSPAVARGRRARAAIRAERWQRDDVRAFVASVPKAAASERSTNDGSARNRETVPAVPAGASGSRVRAFPRRCFARDFFRDPALVSPMLAAFEAAYLPRDHPLVTPRTGKASEEPCPATRRTTPRGTSRAETRRPPRRRRSRRKKKKKVSHGSRVTGTTRTGRNR